MEDEEDAGDDDLLVVTKEDLALKKAEGQRLEREVQQV